MARLIFRTLPLAIASTLQTAVLALLLLDERAPDPLVLIASGAVLLAIVVHVRETTSLSPRRLRSALVALGRTIAWMIIPPCVAVGAAILLTGGSLGVTFELGTLILCILGGALWLVLLVLLERRYGTLSMIRSATQELRPALVLVPGVFTFLLANGSISALILAGYVELRPNGEMPHELLLGGAEAVVCALLVFAWSRIVGDWLRSSWFWVISVPFLHAVTAGFRTHRWDLEMLPDGRLAEVGSGPLITQTFDWPDTLAALVGFAFYLLWRRRNAARVAAQRAVAVGRTDVLMSGTHMA